MCVHVIVVIINNRNGKGRDDKLVIVNEDRPFRLPFDRATTKADPLVKLRIRGETSTRARPPCVALRNGKPSGNER